jgi:hypothetical protein
VCVDRIVCEWGNRPRSEGTSCFCKDKMMDVLVEGALATPSAYVESLPPIPVRHQEDCSHTVTVTATPLFLRLILFGILRLEKYVLNNQIHDCYPQNCTRMLEFFKIRSGEVFCYRKISMIRPGIHIGELEARDERVSR